MAGKAVDQHPKTAQVTNIIIPRKSKITIISNFTVQMSSRECCAEI